MSSFYDDASLVVIPSGYKTSKVYAEKPTDGSGDLAFTRTGDTATRVNSAGLIEKVRTNLLTYSNTFSNAAWTKVGGTTLTGGQADPFGGSDAWKWEATGAATIQLTQNPAGSAERTVSIYAKAGNITSFSLWIGSAVTFNLSSGTITAGTGTITSVGNGWYRCTATAAATSHNPYFVATTAGDHIFLAFAQMENGDIATSYIATTTAAVSVGPVANVPRLDYLGSTCGKLLLEPQRTNLVQYSEQFDNAYWIKSNATITANTTVSPDGTQNADTAVITAGGYIYAEFISYAAVTGQSATLSVFAKNATSTLLVFGGATTAGTDVYKIENYGNGWYRHSVVRTFTATATTTLQYLITLVGTSIIWGAQVEGSNSGYATSYIPTLAASATRGADACSKTGISSLIGQTEGTIFAEVYPEEFVDGSYIGISDGTFTNRIIFGFEGGAGNLLVFGNTGLSGAGTYTRGQKIKIAIAYKSGSSALYVNGAAVSTSAGTFTASYSQFNFNSGAGSQNFVGKCSQALLFKTRLSNADLVALTA